MDISRILKANGIELGILGNDKDYIEIIDFRLNRIK
jgi:hypothetical protein